MSYKQSLTSESAPKYKLSIARWFNNKNCAISLRFDDNLESHFNFVVPHLNKQNIKATFMINPGRNNPIISYIRNKNFWENELPLMGHRLGNHTWNHKGAKNLEEAEFEIGETSRLIWKLYPNESKLNVFASGGGETWGGRRWSKAAFQYKELPEKYFLLDLYSGEHQRIEMNTRNSRDDWKRLIEDTISNKKHGSFVFHKVGSKSIADHLKEILTGYNNCFSEIQFVQFISDLLLHQEDVWIAPVIDIMKYEKECYFSELKLLNTNINGSLYSLKIGTDPSLYDQNLSLVLSLENGPQKLKLYQDDEEIGFENPNQINRIYNVKPYNSKILINFEN